GAAAPVATPPAEPVATLRVFRSLTDIDSLRRMMMAGDPSTVAPCAGRRKGACGRVRTMEPRERLAAVSIAADIRRARTLPAWIPPDAGLSGVRRGGGFARSWRGGADADRVKVPGAVHPVTLLEGGLDEPLLLARDRDDRVHCYSNVCTHRGTIVCEQA